MDVSVIKVIVCIRCLREFIDLHVVRLTSRLIALIRLLLFVRAETLL